MYAEALNIFVPGDAMILCGTKHQKSVDIDRLLMGGKACKVRNNMLHGVEGR